VPTARDKLDLRVAKQNVNLCRATVAGAAAARYWTDYQSRPDGRRLVTSTYPARLVATVGGAAK
jgi:hypothetical protein